MKEYLIGSKYFFKGIKGFQPHDTDTLIVEENPQDYKVFMQITGRKKCLFKWKLMTPNEYIDYMLNICKTPMVVGKFLNREFCEDIGFTIEHLKQLEPLFNQLDERHTYEKIIYDAYMENNDFFLTEKQRMKAYQDYVISRHRYKTRVKGK